MARSNKQPRLHFESLVLLVISSLTMFWLSYLHCIQEELNLQNNFAGFMVKYGFYLALGILFPCIIYMLCDFIVSCKARKVAKKEKATIKKQKTLEKAAKEKEYEEFLEFYNKYFEKGSH